MKYSYLLRISLFVTGMAGMGDLCLGQVVTPRLERKIERQEQRLNNRVQYYNQQAWTQLNPWLTRNQVPAASRAARVANAAANAAVNATAAANTRYGYLTPNAVGTQPAWIYDYYTYAPTYYSTPAANATLYGNAIRYHDTNGDGGYDSVATFRDSSNSGKFDVYDRYDFSEFDKNNEKENDKNNDGFPDSPVDSKRHTVTGKIDATKAAKVNGVESLVVRVAASTANANNDNATLVDLGPATLWQSMSVKEGDLLTATGPLEQIGDKTVMIAESASVGRSKQVIITRLSPMHEGQVVDVTQTEVKGVQHTLAIIDSGSDRQIVDLGPSTALKVKIEPKTTLSVRGIPVQVRDHNIIMAEVVDLGGQKINIQRW